MSPFDSARYARLLEGLEAVEFPFSLVAAKERFDSESLSKTAFLLSKKLGLQNLVALETVAHVSDGNHLSIANEFSESTGVRYLRGQDISGEMMLDDGNAVFIPESEYEKLSRSHIFQDDVLVTIVGANTGYTALVFESPQKLTANCKLGILRTRKDAAIEPAYLHAFLAGKYGQFQIEYAKRGGGQTGLILPDLRALKIPRLSSQLERCIADRSIKAHELTIRAQRMFCAPEGTLLNALGLEHWHAPDPLSYVRNSRDAFAAVRLDAEHFQECYYDLKSRLTTHEGGFSSVGNLAASLTNGAEIRAYQAEGTPYLRVGDIRHLTVDGKSVVRVNSVLAESEKLKVRLEVGDVLVSRSGSLAVTAVVEPEWADALISSHLIRVKISDQTFDPYYLAFFLAALPGRMQIKQWSNGGVQPEISQPSLCQVIVPRVSKLTQMSIREKILEGRRNKDKALQLRASAQRAVEIAIEDSESAALTYLEGFGA